MAQVTFDLHARVKHRWLLKAINFPLLALGLKPWIPRSFIETKVVFTPAESDHAA